MSHGTCKYVTFCRLLSRIMLCVLKGRHYFPVQCWKIRSYFPVHIEIYTGHFRGSIVFLWTFPREQFFFVFHSQHPRGNVWFEQASLFFLLFSIVRYVMTRGRGCKLDFSIFLNCKARQHLEAWQASIYGHLRESANFSVCIRFGLKNFGRCT